MSKKLNDASIETVTSLTTSRYLNSIDPSTGEIDKITVANFITQVGSVPLVYAANISQTSNTAPTATTPVNNIGATITFARSSPGTYTATASSPVFTANKTFAFLANTLSPVILVTEVISTTVVAIKTYDGSFGTFVLSDDLLSNNSFKIEIYP